MEKQLIWVFESRKSVHYWWSYISFAPERKKLTCMLGLLLYRWGVPPAVIRCVHWIMQREVLQTWITPQSPAIVMTGTPCRAWGSLGLYTSEQHWSDMLHYNETDNLLTVLTSTQKSSRADSTSSRGPDIRTLVLPMLTWSLSFHASLPEDNSLAVPPAILSFWFADPEQSRDHLMKSDLNRKSQKGTECLWLSQRYSGDPL